MSTPSQSKSAFDCWSGASHMSSNLTVRTRSLWVSFNGARWSKVFCMPAHTGAAHPGAPYRRQNLWNERKHDGGMDELTRLCQNPWALDRWKESRKEWRHSNVNHTTHNTIYQMDDSEVWVGPQVRSWPVEPDLFGNSQRRAAAEVVEALLFLFERHLFVCERQHVFLVAQRERDPIFQQATRVRSGDLAREDSGEEALAFKLIDFSEEPVAAPLRERQGS
mmetsp:Transcript_25020/g.50127  ORF Transcript_25020/g.50127 Transcript_25020/m.50127 type:complete len:221 (+) Transcript_25020:170-832(+)